jgi:PAS domain S-box-containing protein
LGIVNIQKFLLSFVQKRAFRRHKLLAGPRTADLLNEMTDGYAETDEDLRFTMVNKAAESLLGYPADRILGRTFMDILGSHSALALMARLQAIIASGESAQFEHTLTPSIPCVEIRVRRTERGLSLFLQNLSHLRKIEQALAHETERRHIIEERFETALSVSQIVVYKMDCELQYSWVYNNQLGRMDKDIVYRTPEDFFEPESAQRLSTFLRSVLVSGQAQRKELMLRSLQTDEERYFVSSARPVFDDNYQVVGLAGASIEITKVVRQRQELAIAREEAFVAKAEADRASLSKSKFLAAASHDLRQPVQSLLLLIEVLKNRLAGSPVQKAVDQMEEAVNALHLLFDSMLDISRLDAGVIVPSLQTVDMGALLGRLADEYRLRAEHQGLDFRMMPTSAYVRTDPLLIERVLRNLLENALRYCPTGRLLVGCRRRGKTLQIDVADTGIGVAPDHLEDIFEEFHQVANTARDRSRGLGLGLSIVKRIMRLLGGTVSVRSTLGRGSCFSITLPMARRVKSGERRTAGRTEGEGRMIMVIEDDTLLRDSLDMMLRNWGYRTMTATLGEEALAMIGGRNLPDAVISDYRLSAGMTGIETVLRIGETMGQPVPSLIITGDTAPERVREVHGRGLRILHKPVAAEDLRRAVRGMVHEHSEQRGETLS